MKEFTGRPGFYDHSRAWYHQPGQAPTITVGFYTEGGGTEGEFSIFWDNLGLNLVPKLRAYPDSWQALYAIDRQTGFLALLAKLAEFGVAKSITPAQLSDELTVNGLNDLTHYTQTPPAETPAKTILRLEKKIQELEEKLQNAQ